MKPTNKIFRFELWGTKDGKRAVKATGIVTAPDISTAIDRAWLEDDCIMAQIWYAFLNLHIWEEVTT